MAPVRRLKDLLGDEGTREGKPESISRLRDADDWAQMLDSSKAEPVLVFKHSTVCGISSEALREVGGFLSENDSVLCGIVYVVEDRNLSDIIAEQTGIRQESPQIIAIENERPIWHASHWIDLEELERILGRSGKTPDPANKT